MPAQLAATATPDGAPGRLNRAQFAELAQAETLILDALRTEAVARGVPVPLLTASFEAARDGFHRLFLVAGAYRAEGA